MIHVRKFNVQCAPCNNDKIKFKCVILNVHTMPMRHMQATLYGKLYFHWQRWRRRQVLFVMVKCLQKQTTSENERKMAIPPQWHTHTLSAACVQQFIYELITKWAVCKLSCILKFVMLNFTHNWKPVSFLMQQKHEAFDACHFIGRSSLKCRLRLTHWIMSDHLN